MELSNLRDNDGISKSFVEKENEAIGKTPKAPATALKLIKNLLTMKNNSR